MEFSITITELGGLLYPRAGPSSNVQPHLAAIDCGKKIFTQPGKQRE